MTARKNREAKGMEDNATRQYLTFVLGGERFALESLLVSEVLDMPVATRVPLGPPYLHGIVNLRGNAATVVDLGRLLGLDRSGDDRGACLIVLERDYDGERALLAALADAVQEVVEIAREDLAATPEMGLAVDPRFLRGLARLDGDFVMVLDADRIFSLEELTSRRQA
jgi:purine-binding chemotaxis protein CheW